jgi:hypothetical protein
MTSLENYTAKSGSLEAVYTIEIQTLPDNVDKILDAILEVHPLDYGRCHRKASISAVGMETLQPDEDSASAAHIKGFKVGERMTYPMVELKFSIERDMTTLEKVMDVILSVHHYAEPTIFVREDWASRAVYYDTDSKNPNRWWNDGKGLPKKIKSK